MWLFNVLFSSLSQLGYVDVRIFQSVSVSPLEFEIMRVDCSSRLIYLAYNANNMTYNSSEGFCIPPQFSMELCCSLCFLYGEQYLHRIGTYNSPNDHKTVFFPEAATSSEPRPGKERANTYTK